jgi:predicted RNA-binding Zn-ribbon protein involved in translation (DUF1610 family)
MEPQFDLKDTVQFYCPNSACKKAITYRHLEDYFGRQSQDWEQGRFPCPHCDSKLRRQVIRRFDSGGYQWIPEQVGGSHT